MCAPQSNCYKSTACSYLLCFTSQCVHSRKNNPTVLEWAENCTMLNFNQWRRNHMRTILRKITHYYTFYAPCFPSKIAPKGFIPENPHNSTKIYRKSWIPMYPEYSLLFLEELNHFDELKNTYSPHESAIRLSLPLNIKNVPTLLSGTNISRLHTWDAFIFAKTKMSRFFFLVRSNLFPPNWRSPTMTITDQSFLHTR